MLQRLLKPNAIPTLKLAPSSSSSSSSSSPPSPLPLSARRKRKHIDVEFEKKEGETIGSLEKEIKKEKKEIHNETACGSIEICL